MLNADAIQGAMQRLGLHQSALAERIGVSKESVSKWLSGQTIPRPDKIRRIADVLGCSVEDVLQRAATPKPVVAFRTHMRRPVREDAKAAGDDIGEHLRQLTPYIAKSLLAPRQLDAPSTDPAYVALAASEERRQIGLSELEVPTIDQIVGLLSDSGASVVPVLWGRDKPGQENALSVYLENPPSVWVLFSLGCFVDDIRHWLAHELGHCLTLHKLRGDDGEAFAEVFAQEFLFPPALAKQCYDRITEASGDKLQLAAQIAAQHGISIIGVVRGADRAAARAGLPPTGLDNGTLYEVWRVAQKETPTLGDVLWKGELPSAEAYVQTCEEKFKTPVFRALAEWQKNVGGTSPAFVASALNIGIGQAYELSKYLAQRVPELL